MADVEKLNINSTDYNIADATARAGLLNKQDIIQVSTMPTASAANLGKIVQWVGGGSTYSGGYFYKCIYNGSRYVWARNDTQPQYTLPAATALTKGGIKVGNGLEMSSDDVLSTNIKVFNAYQNPDDYDTGTIAYFSSTNGYIDANNFYVATGRFVVNVSITSATCTYDD